MIELKPPTIMKPWVYKSPQDGYWWVIGGQYAMAYFKEWKDAIEFAFKSAEPKP